MTVDCGDGRGDHKASEPLKINRILPFSAWLVRQIKGEKIQTNATTFKLYFGYKKMSRQPANVVNSV